MILARGMTSGFTEKTKMAFFESCNIWIYIWSNCVLQQYLGNTFKNLLSARMKRPFVKKKSLHTFVLNYRYKQLQCCQARYYRLSSKFLKKCQKFDFYIFKVISYFLHENIEFAAPSQDARGENRIIDGR